MRAPIFAVLLTLYWSLTASDTIAFGNCIVSVGDSVGRAYEVAGKPDRVVQLDTPQGGEAGQRFEYFLRGTAVLITVQGGRVVEIEEVRD